MQKTENPKKIPVTVASNTIDLTDPKEAEKVW